MLVLSALAIGLLTLLGAAGESLGYDRWLRANTVKYRTHSLFRQGLMLYEHIPNWPEHRLRPLMKRFTQQHGSQRPYRWLEGKLPAPACGHPEDGGADLNAGRPWRTGRVSATGGHWP